MAPSPCVCFIDILLVLIMLLMFLPVADTSSNIQPIFLKNGSITNHSTPTALNHTTQTAIITTVFPSVRPTPTSVHATNSSTTVHPSKSTVHISSTVHPSPSSSVHHHSIFPTSPITPTVQPCATVSCASCDGYKSKMWVATSFAIILGIINAILIFVMVRQQRIHRDIEGDPALSRLI